MRLGDIPAYRSYQLAYARGDLAAAEEALRVALDDERARDDADLRSFFLRCLASILGESGKPEAARSALSDAASASVSSIEAAMMTASAWLNILGDAEAALASASELLPRAMSDAAQKSLAAQLLALKGRCLAELGESEAARSCLLDLRALAQPHVVEHALELCELLLSHDASRIQARSYLAEMLAALERLPEENDELRRYMKEILERP